MIQPKWKTRYNAVKADIERDRNSPLMTGFYDPARETVIAWSTWEGKWFHSTFMALYFNNWLVIQWLVLGLQFLVLFIAGTYQEAKNRVLIYPSEFYTRRWVYSEGKLKYHEKYGGLRRYEALLFSHKHEGRIWHWWHCMAFYDARPRMRKVMLFPLKATDWFWKIFFFRIRQPF